MSLAPLARRANRWAYVPEHLVALMSGVSGAEAHMYEDCLAFARRNWLIFVGYPLESEFEAGRVERLVRQAAQECRPEHLWFIGPQIPAGVLEQGQNRQSDWYYRLDLAGLRVKPALRRQVEKTTETLEVTCTRSYGREHRRLAEAFMQRQPLPEAVAELYRAMPAYFERSPGACLLEGRDRRGRLNAFYVIEQSAAAFDTYVLGCYSKENYLPHASDRLFWEMIEEARRAGKGYLHLGLGVNDGIRRFKQKWGGTPYLPYEYCACVYPRSPAAAILEYLQPR